MLIYAHSIYLYLKGGVNMKKFVFNRQVDVLGRIVLPIELRHNLGIEAKDTVKLIPVENGILIVPSKQN